MGIGTICSEQGCNDGASFLSELVKVGVADFGDEVMGGQNSYPIAKKFTARQLGSHEETKTRRRANCRGGSYKERAIDQITQYAQRQGTAK